MTRTSGKNRTARGRDFCLRQGLESVGLSQRQLAKRLGVSENYLSRIANGHGAPSWATAVLIAEAAGVSLDAFRPVPPATASEPVKKRRRRRPAAEEGGEG